MKFQQLQRNLLTQMGFSLNKNESFIWIIYAYSNWLALAVIIMPEVNFVIANIADIQLATEALCPMLTCLTSLAKLVSIQMNKLLVYKMVADLKEMWNKGILVHILK